MSSTMTSDKITPGHAFGTHDHSHCIVTALAEAEAVCRDAGLRLTPVRRKTLEVLVEEHRAMGAYEVLERLREEGFGSQPPVAYRALDFLVANGFVHRIERLNAFIACSHPGETHAPVFMICRLCKTVAEAITPARDAIGSAAAAAGFQIERTVVEAEGLCPSCAEGSAA
jgi:Fur family zinc uptake transcriptional regulator